jgi:4-carboxymuconolactone decarboxylase
MIDEGFVQDEAGIGFGLARASALDPKTAALLQAGVSVAIGSPAVCLEWSTSRALAASASEDEIAGVLLAIAPVAGLGRIAAAAPEVATAAQTRDAYRRCVKPSTIHASAYHPPRRATVAPYPLVEPTHPA